MNFACRFQPPPSLPPFFLARPDHTVVVGYLAADIGRGKSLEHVRFQIASYTKGNAEGDTWTFGYDFLFL